MPVLYTICFEYYSNYNFLKIIYKHTCIHTYIYTVCCFPYIYSDFNSMYIVTFEYQFGVLTIG